MDLHTLITATNRFYGEDLSWPPELRVDVRFCGGVDTPPDVFMQRCFKGFLREVSLIGDVDTAFLPTSRIEWWARMLCTGSFARSLMVSPQLLCSSMEALSYYNQPGKISLRFAEAVKRLLHIPDGWSIDEGKPGTCPAFNRRFHEIRACVVPPDVRATMMMLAFTPVHIAAALCDELRAPYPLRVVIRCGERVKEVVDEHPCRMCAVKQVRLVKLLADERTRVTIEGWALGGEHALPSEGGHQDLRSNVADASSEGVDLIVK